MVVTGKTKEVIVFSLFSMQLNSLLLSSLFRGGNKCWRRGIGGQVISAEKFGCGEWAAEWGKTWFFYFIVYFDQAQLTLMLIVFQKGQQEVTSGDDKRAGERQW